MDARDRLIEAALALLEQAGETNFTTRAACEAAGVTAPTLYHHFRDANGLVSAAVLRGFDQFLARKKERETADPRQALLEGWDDYVAFARERPKLYAAMFTRVLQGAMIPAAIEARAHLVGTLQQLQAEQALALPVEAAADLVWSTAHAAACLYLTPPTDPSPAVVAGLRAAAASVLLPPDRGLPDA